MLSISRVSPTHTAAPTRTGPDDAPAAYRSSAISRYSTRMRGSHGALPAPRASPLRASFRQPRSPLGRAQRLVQPRRDPALFRIQMPVARTQRQAVRFAHRGHADDLHGHIQIRDHAPDHRQLLRILFAELRAIRLHDLEQLQHHRGHAAEMARPESAFHVIRHPSHFHESRLRRGYISSTDGANTTSTPRAAQNAKSAASGRGYRA